MAKHNSPSPNCMSLYEELIDLERERIMLERNNRHDMLQKSSDIDTEFNELIDKHVKRRNIEIGKVRHSISKKYDELMKCECNAGRCEDE